MKYRVWMAEDGEEKDDGRLVEAGDHGHAAEKYAEWKDSWGADYLIVGGQPATVCVAEDFDGAEVRRFVVHGRPEPVYSAYAA